jgi:hypothetical protein
MSWLDASFQVAGPIVDGFLTIGITTSLTLSKAQYTVRALKFTGALIAGATITMPLSLPEGWWFVENATTGGFALTFAGVSGTGVVLAPGTRTEIYTDGVNVYAAAAGGFVGLGSNTLTYGTVVATTSTGAVVGDIAQFFTGVTDGVAFTMSLPTGYLVGQTLTYYIKNNSGGAMGAITWNAGFFLAGGTFTNPAAGKARSITFFYQGGGKFAELSRASADI